MTAKQIEQSQLSLQQQLEHNQLLGYWAKTIGITLNDLNHHPQIDDVILLIKFIKEYNNEFTPKQRIQVFVIWDWCYQKKKPLSKKYLKALTKLVFRLQQIRNIRLQAKLKARKKIKALKTNT